MRWTRLPVLAAIAMAMSAVAAEPALTLERAQAAQLAASPVGAEIVLAGVPDGRGGSATLRLRRIEVFAPGARLLRVGAGGEHELPRSARTYWIGADASGSVRASLGFDPGFADFAGSGSSPAGAFALAGEPDGARVRLRATPLEATLPAGVVPEIASGEDSLDGGNPPPGALDLALAGMAAPAAAPRGAVVAIDTDKELMSRRFGNSTSAATAWIGDLFAAMNAMYVADLDLNLQVGRTILRVGSDPYATTGSPAGSAHLAEFGTYWQNQYGSVPRTMAMLLSGRSSSGNSASGIAWINAYCRKPSQGGSYSVNQVFTNAQVAVAYSARLVGHELGHNFGAYHTHCTNAANGSAPTGANTIDRCNGGESGCYSGATSCPSSGPGAPAGTVMSYCNSIGCGSQGQNVLQFHPTQIVTLSALIAQNTPACIAPSADRVFADGFER